MESVKVIDVGGVKVPLDPEVLSPALIKAMEKDGYEHARRKNLRPMVEKGDRIADIGGGIGYTSTMMAQEGRAAFIVSIEGHPGVQDAARRLHALNGVEVTVRHALVVTENTGGPTRPFYLSRDFWGSSMLPDVKHPVGVVDVEVITFGQIIAEYAPNMLVIDLEVMKEYLHPESSSGALESMELTGVDKIVIHFVHHFHGDGAGTKRVFDYFSAHGFHYNIDHSRGSVVLFTRLPA